MRCLVVLVVLLRVAHADTVDELRRDGEELARKGELSQAIAKFKQADALAPHASLACLIGLAYTRRELWPQADLYFALCKERASATDPLPEWWDESQQQLAQKLATANAIAVELAITPASANAKMWISSFAPDEVFAPHTIHLPPGRHTIHVDAPGYLPVRRDIEVDAQSPRHLVVPIALQAPPPRAYPTYIVAGGLALGVAGLAVDIFSVAPARSALANATSFAGYQNHLDAYTTRRDIAVGLFGGAALAVATGLVLRWALPHPHDEIQLAASASHDRVMVTAGWSR